MRTRTCPLTLAALIGLAVAAAATDYEASDYLPLAVGNSWTLGHGVYDFFQQRVPGDAYTDWPVYFEKRGRFTITVERTRSSTTRRITCCPTCRRATGRQRRRTSSPARNCDGRGPT